MREGAFWAAILRGWTGSKQLEGGFSPLMWKGKDDIIEMMMMLLYPLFLLPFLFLSFDLI